MDDFRKYETNSQEYDQITSISKMDALAYDIQRKEISKQLGVNLVTLDNLRKHKQADNLQELSDYVVENIRPWHNPVDALQIGTELEKILFQHLVLNHLEYATGTVL